MSFGVDIIFHLDAFRVGLVVQDVARDAFKHLAELVERREADGTAFTRLEQGKVGHGYSDPFGELRELHVAFPEHFVEIDGDHIARLLSFAVR